MGVVVVLEIKTEMIEFIVAFYCSRLKSTDPVLDKMKEDHGIGKNICEDSKVIQRD